MAKNNVYFEDELCKGCYLCVEFCPTKILKVNKHKMNLKGYFVIEVVDQDRCIGCAHCAIVCPDSVITVVRLD